MIFINTKTYAKVWEVKKEENRPTQLKISTNRKNDAGEYIYSQMYVNLSRNAEQKVPNLESGQTILINKMTLCCEAYTNAEGKKVYPKGVRITITDAEFPGDGPRAQQPKDTQTKSAAVAPDDDLPF